MRKKFTRHTNHGLREPDHGLKPLKKIEPPRPGESVYRSTRWKTLSLQLKRARPACEMCGAAEDLSVDHIVPLRELPGDPERHPLAWDEGNLRVLCRHCHVKAEIATRKRISDDKFRDALSDQLNWLDE